MQNKSKQHWQHLLEDYEHSLELFRNVRLMPKDIAVRQDESNIGSIHNLQNEAKNQAVAKRIAELRNNKEHEYDFSNIENQPILWPYVEGIEDALKEALRWLRNPPRRLHEGLVLLAESNTPTDLSKLFDLYGQYSAYYAIAMARDAEYSAQKSGGDNLNDQRIYASSMMTAFLRYGDMNMAGARYQFLAHVLAVINDNTLPILGWKTEEYKPFVKENTALRKADEKGRDDFVLNNTFQNHLTEGDLPFWTNESLVSCFRYMSPPDLGLEAGVY